MRKRQGFVSNSSSSSFILVSKSGELTKEKLMKSFKTQKGDFFHPIAEKLSEYLINYSTKETTVGLLGDWGVDNISELPEALQKGIKSNGTVYIGSADDQTDNPVELLLVDLELNYEDDDIILTKEAGY